MGTRTFDYNDQLHLESESITGLYDRTVIRYYETEDEAVPGCSTGFSIGDTYDVAYGYDSTGRMDPVGWSVNGVEDTAEYSYLPNSNLLSGMTTTSGQNTSYIYWSFLLRPSGPFTGPDWANRQKAKKLQILPSIKHG